MKQPHIMKEYGPLDLWLAKKRYRMAQKLVSPVADRRRILDIGCGCYPLFLTVIHFAEK
jgi:hypothetical protein